MKKELPTSSNYKLKYNPVIKINHMMLSKDNEKKDEHNQSINARTKLFRTKRMNIHTRIIP